MEDGINRVRAIIDPWRTWKMDTSRLDDEDGRVR
jgi:hypothetical protein